LRATEIISVWCVGGAAETNPDALKDYLRSLPHIRLSESPQVPETPTDVHLVVTAGGGDLDRIEKAISSFVENGGAWLHIVGLMPDPVAAVTATRHNRVWQDVTNADQERIQIRFAGGKEAEFIHSEIAAIRKPKWYLLPNHMHRKWSLKALAAGKHVLCEKPLALNAREAREMADAAEDAGRLLMEGFMEGFMYRFHPGSRRLHRMVNEGAIGALKLVRAAFCYRMEPEVIAADNNYRLMVEHFSDAISGKGDPADSPQESVRNLQVLDALAKAAVTGRTMRPAS
jgi:hypothetical protein